jgi:SAM-dependent methyltransferase
VCRYNPAMHAYKNPWMPRAALEALSSSPGPVLDFGGGAAPYHRAAHVLDVVPFDPDRLRANAWGGPAAGWAASQYTEFDACAGEPWPFPDGAFALGLCSHTLEDLRDPLPALAELGRVCRTLLLVCPSRLAEQCRGIDHPRYAGFFHHPWMVGADSAGLVFRRKTSNLELPGCHLTLPAGRTLTVEAGTFLYHGPPLPGREVAFWEPEADAADYRAFLAPYRGRSDHLAPDPRPLTWRRRVYRLRQKYLGAP